MQAYYQHGIAAETDGTVTLAQYLVAEMGQLRARWNIIRVNDWRISYWIPTYPTICAEAVAPSFPRPQGCMRAANGLDPGLEPRLAFWVTITDARVIGESFDSFQPLGMLTGKMG
jgi:hypothetical protein